MPVENPDQQTSMASYGQAFVVLLEARGLDPLAVFQAAGVPLLTPKEQEVLQLLANNLVNKEIASAMDISVEGVKWHMRNLFEKLNAGNRRHLLSRARMLGLLDP